MSIHIQKNANLKPYNTLRVSALAQHLCSITSISDLRSLITDYPRDTASAVILGEGSNILLTKDIQGLVIKNEINGKKIISTSANKVKIQVGAGENWHQLVQFCVQKNWFGIENLSLIPGTVGASPVQNISAYGQQVADSIHQVSALNLKNGESHAFSKKECRFGYRDSIFKHDKRWIITSVTLKLKKHTDDLKTEYHSIGRRYDSIEKQLAKHAKKPYTALDIANAVASIRRAKLLDHNLYPTVGSYFINPQISQKKYQQLAQIVPHLQAYPTTSSLVKIPAGRLIDYLGWAGKQIGNVYMYEKWASIVTHNGNASGKEIQQYLEQVAQDVKEHFDIDLESEVTTI